MSKWTIIIYSPTTFSPNTDIMLPAASTINFEHLQVQELRNFQHLQRKIYNIKFLIKISKFPFKNQVKKFLNPN